MNSSDKGGWFWRIIGIAFMSVVLICLLFKCLIPCRPYFGNFKND